jgi:hypothetical protein
MEKNREQIFNTVAQKAKKIGEFLFGTMEAPLHMSDYYVKEHFEPTDGEAYQPELPFDDEVIKLVQVAKKAKNIPAYDDMGTYIEDYEV